MDPQGTFNSQQIAEQFTHFLAEAIRGGSPRADVSPIIVGGLTVVCSEAINDPCKAFDGVHITYAMTGAPYIAPGS